MIVPLSPIRCLYRAVDLYGKKIGVVSGQRRFTYGEFGERCERLASALNRMGIRPGDRVAYLSFNNHQLLEGYFGVVLAHAIVMPLNVRLTPAELICILNHSQARVLESWGNAGKCEIVGLPHLDRYCEFKRRLRQPDEPFRILMMTAKTPFFTGRPDSASLTILGSGTCGAVRITERVLLTSPRARTEMTKSPRRTLATGTSISVVPVNRYAANPAPPKARTATDQPMILLFTERFCPILFFGFTSFDAMS